MWNSTLQKAIEDIAKHLKHIREYLGFIAIVVVCTGIYRCSCIQCNNVHQAFATHSQQIIKRHNK